MPICSLCGQVKKDADFYRRNSGRLRRDCKRCHSDRAWKRIRNDSELLKRHAARVRADRKANPGRVKATRQAWGKAHPEKMLAAHLKSRFGLSYLEYDKMVLDQNGMCAICECYAETKRLCVDHCHKTGTIRGLLCSSCNTMLGHAKDSPGILAKAAIYLRASS